MTRRSPAVPLPANPIAPMRPDVGLSTIAVRLAGLRSITPAPQPPAAGFDDALAAVTGAGADAAPGAGFAAAGFGGFGAGGMGGFLPPGIGGSPSLGPGVRLVGGSLISPQLPGATATAYGVGAPVGTGTPGPARSGPPPELQAYGNGRIPPHALQPLGVEDHQLWAPAARAYTDLAAAAARDGVHIGINSSYRSVEEQQELVDRYGLYSQGGRAAAPGSSDHGWGVSVDLQLDDRAQAWMRANAGRYGFVEDVPREPWHWTFTAASY